MISPIIEIRERIGLNQADLAHMVKLSPPTMSYIENGAYSSLPVGLLNFLKTYDEDIEIKWNRWKLEKRLEWPGPVELPSEFPDMMDFMHPHVEWRQVYCGLNVTHYAEALCVHRSQIQILESGVRYDFPKELYMALLMACGSEIAERIKEACDRST